jgi:hypothetical protein
MDLLATVAPIIGYSSSLSDIQTFKQKHWFFADHSFSSDLHGLAPSQVAEELPKALLLNAWIPKSAALTALGTPLSVMNRLARWSIMGRKDYNESLITVVKLSGVLQALTGPARAPQVGWARPFRGNSTY